MYVHFLKIQFDHEKFVQKNMLLVLFMQMIMLYLPISQTKHPTYSWLTIVKFWLV